jgi:hypothetical protein
MDYPKSDPSVGLVNGLFVDEDSITGQPGSLIPAAWANALMTELLTVVDHAGLEPDEEDNTQILQALIEVFAAREDSIPKVATRPVTNVGPVIYVEDQMTLMHWVSTAFFTGYRSPFSGKLEFGWTPTPLPWQVEAIGNTLNETDHGGVIARFRESGLTVALGSWVAGEYKIADMGGGEWKAPDMRDMFLRFTGTDADTANARMLGSTQASAFESHVHGLLDAIDNSGNSNYPIIAAMGASVSGNAAPTQLAGGTETRPRNTALVPIINL